jgi:formate hydrogenlyase transcriptional activator
MPSAQLDGQTTLAPDQYRALFAVSDAIASHRDREALFRELAARLGQVVRFDVLSLVIYDPATNIMRRHILEGTQPLPPPSEMVFDLVDDPARFAWQTQQPLIAYDLAQLARWPKYVEFVQRYGGQSFCFLPLTTARRRLGTLVFGSRQAGTYDDVDVHFLQLVANQVAAAVENSMAFQEVEALFAVSDAIASHRDRDALFRELAVRLAQVVRFEVLTLALHDPATNLLRRHVSEATTQHAVPPTSEMVLDLADDPAWFAWETQQPFIAANMDQLKRWPKYSELARRYGAECFCYLPLTTARRRLGVLVFGSRRPGTYDDANVHFLQLVANQVAVAVENASAFQEIEALNVNLAAEKAYLRQAHERLDLAMRGSNVIIWDLEMPDGIIENARLSVTNLWESLGYDAATGPVDFSSVFAQVVHPDDQDRVMREIRALLASDLQIYETKYRLLSRDGTARWYLVRGTLVRDSNGRHVRHIGTSIDVDALKRAEEAVSERERRLATEKAYLEEEVRTEHNFGDIVGENPGLRSALRHVAIVAPTDSTVLVCGETGTGKELIARAVHDLSPRKARTFVKLNCAAIPTGLLESELFGHEKGAFTGAVAQKVGRFELANQGTLFLDEVGDIPLELQPKLLRVLQEQEFERLGGTKTMRVNVRLVAATNRDLSRMVADGQFRSDLYYRLNVFPIVMPPLWQRADDIPRLVRHFTQLFSRRMGRRIEAIPSEAMDALVRYPWPGNVRELQNVIERAVILSNGPTLTVSLADLETAPATVSAPSTARVSAPVPVTLSDAEREHIVITLAATNWVVGGPKGAAARLGMKRSTLQKKMQKLGISRPA